MQAPVFVAPLTAFFVQTYSPPRVLNRGPVWAKCIPAARSRRSKRRAGQDLDFCSIQRIHSETQGENLCELVDG